MAERFFLTSQVGIAVSQQDLRSTTKTIKDAFKSVSKIETQIKTPSNLADFRRKIKAVVSDLSKINTKITVDASSLSSVKSNVKKQLSSIGEVKLRLVLPSNLDSTVNRLHKKLQSAGTINVKLNLPANINTLARQISQLNRVGGTTINIGNNANNIRNTTNAVRNATQNFKALKDQVESFGAQSEYAIRRYAAFTLVAANFYSLFNAIKSGLGRAIEFEKELIKIRQVTGTSIQDLGSLADTVTNLSTSLGVSSAKLLNVSQILAQAGFSAKDVKISLDTLAKTELSATFDDITNSAEGMIAIVSQFGTSAEDFKTQFSAINTVSAKFAVESSDIVTAVRRTGGAFKAAGGDLNELIALFTAVRATTRASAESIGTGFRTIFARLQRVRTQNFLKDLGVNLRDVDNQFIGPYKSIERLSEALNKIPTTDPRFAQVIEELGGYRQIQHVIPLITQVEKRQQAYNLAKRSGNSLDEDAAKAADSLSNKLQKVTEQFDGLIRKVASSDSFKSITDTMLRTANSAIQLTDALIPLLPLLTSFSVLAAGNLVPRLAKGFLGFGDGTSVGGQRTTVSNIRNSSSGSGKFINNVKNNPITSASIGSLLLPSLIDSIVPQLTGINTNGFTTSLARVGGQSAIYGGIGSAIGGRVVDFARINNSRKSLGIGSQINDLRDPYNNLTRRINREYNKNNPNQTKILQLETQRDAIAQQVIALKDSRAKLLSVSKNLSALDKNIPALALGIGAFTGIINEVATGLENRAKENLSKERYSDFSTNKVAASTLTVAGSTLGATAGVGIIAAASNPAIAGAIAVGVVLTTLASGIYAFITSLQSSRQDIENDKFKRGFSRTQDILSNISAGKADASVNAGIISQSLSNVQNKLLTGTGPTYETVKGQIGNSILDISNFVTKMAEASNNLDEFKKSTNVAVQFLSKFGDTSVNDIYKEAGNTINNRKAVEKQISLLKNVQDREVVRTSVINGILGSVNSLSTQYDKVGDSLVEFDSIINDTANSFKINLGSKIFEDIKNVGNSKEFSRTANAIGGFFGEEGKKIAGEIGAIPEITRILPNVLLKLQSQPTFEGSEDFIGRFQSELEDIGSIPKEFVTALTDRITQLIGSEAKPDKLATDIRADRFKVANNIADVLEQFTEIFTKAGPEIEKALNTLEEGFASSRRINAQIADRNSKIADILLERESAFAAVDLRPENLNRIQDLNRQRLGTALGSNANLSIGELFNKRNSLIGGIQGLTGRINGGDPSYERLIKERNDLTSQLEELNRGFKELESSIDRDIDVIKRKTEIENENLKARFEFAKVSAFGSRTDINRLGINLGGSAILANNPDDINKIPRQLLPEISSFLDSLGDVELFGKKASDISKNAVRSSLTQGLVRGGLPPVEAKKIADAIADKQSQKKDSLKAELSEAYNRAQELQNAFIKDLGNKQDTLLGHLDDLFIDFKAFLNSAPLNAQKEFLSSNAADLSVKRDEAISKASSVSNLGTKIGFDLTQGSNLDILRKNIPDLQNFSNIAGKIGKLTTISIPEVTDSDNVVSYEQKLQNSFRDVFSQQEIARIIASTGLKDERSSGIGSRSSRSYMYAANREIDTIQKEKLDQLNSDKGTVKTGLVTAFGSALPGVIGNLEEINKLLGPDSTISGQTFSNLTGEIQSYTLQLDSNTQKLEDIQNRLNAIQNQKSEGRQQTGFNKGGRVPGFGNGDTVPAMLTPGEFVLTKEAVAKFGVNRLNKMNNGIQYFGDGGFVGFNELGRSQSDDRLRKIIEEANKILQNTFGKNINDIVGANNIYAGDTSGKYRGAYHKYNKTIGLDRKIAGTPTVLEEVLHALDYRSSPHADLPNVDIPAKYRISTDVTKVPASAKGNNPFARIAELFNDKRGLEALMGVEGHSSSNVKSQQYFAKPSERFAKPLKILLGDKKKLEVLRGLVPEKVSKLEEMLPSLSSYIGKPTVSSRAGIGAKPIGLPINTGSELPNIDYFAGVAGQSQRGRINSPLVTRSSRGLPKLQELVSQRGPNTTTVSQLAKRGISKTTSVIGNNKFVQSGGKALGAAGKVLGPLGVAGIIGDSLYEGSRGNTTKGVTGLLNASLPGFAGNLLGNTINNIGSAFGSGADKVGLFDNSVGNALTNLYDEGGFGIAEQRGRDIDEEFQRQARVGGLREKELTAKSTKVYESNNRAFVKNQNIKSKLGESNYQASVAKTDAQKSQIQANRNKLNAPSTSKLTDILAQEQRKKIARDAYNSSVQSRINDFGPNPVQTAKPYQAEPAQLTKFDKYKQSQISAYNESLRLAQTRTKQGGTTKKYPSHIQTLPNILNDVKDVEITPIPLGRPSDKNIGTTQLNSNIASQLGFATGNGGIDNTPKKQQNKNIEFGDLGKAIQSFSGVATDLAKAMNAFPHKIELTATHAINITHNGAEVFNAILPAMKELCINTTIEKINEFSKKNFKTLPPMEGGGKQQDAK